MSKKLTKAWNRAKEGTEITADPAEAAGGKATLVDPARFAHLEAGGFFGAPPPPGKGSEDGAGDEKAAKDSAQSKPSGAPGDSKLVDLPPPCPEAPPRKAVA